MLGVGDSASGAGWELSQFSLEHGVTVAVASVSVEFKSRLVYRQLCAGDRLAIDSAGRSGGWEEPGWWHLPISAPLQAHCYRSLHLKIQEM